MHESECGPLGLAFARVEHRGDVLHAPDYADSYCTAAGGLGESRHVFLQGNDLPARLALAPADRAFVIGETGFGAGRNMLAAWALFDEVAPARARLHLFSVERHPLCPGDLVRAGARWPSLGARFARLATLWPAPVVGLHRLRLGPRVTLDLYLGDVREALEAFDGQVDAWFADGFAPARNPAMWSAEVFQALAARSRPGASFATYTAARAVREHLSRAGFTWQRLPGFGRKRHMLAGRLGPVLRDTPSKPWCSAVEPLSPGARIAVVGAGIAGASVAEALARRGFEVTVYDRAGVAGGASGNRDAALNPRLAVHPTLRTRFDLAALGYTTRWLADVDPARRYWQDCGLLQLAGSADEAARQAKLLDRLGLPAGLVRGVDRAEAAAIARSELHGSVRGGLYFPGAGSVQPAALCTALLARDGIRQIARHATEIRRDGNGNGNGWRLIDDAGQAASFDHVVLACAGAAHSLCADLPPLGRVRGQTSHFSLSTRERHRAPACVVCGDGYVLPVRDGRFSVGATHEPRARELAVTARGHLANHRRLAALLPRLADSVHPDCAEGRAGWRCTSHDRLPLVGGVPDVAAWRQDYAPLAIDATDMPAIPGALWAGLSVSLAHGSHGMLAAPLAGEMLAAGLCGEPKPVERALVEALHPGRWLIREMMRGRLASTAEPA